MSGFVPTLTNYNAAFSVSENAPNVAGLVLQKNFASDHFELTGRQNNSFVLLSSKNKTESFIWVRKVLPLFRLGFPTIDEESEYVLSSSWNEHHCLKALSETERVCLWWSTDDEVDYTLKQPNRRVGCTLSVESVLVFILFPQ